jgi:hypothetical protein
LLIVFLEFLAQFVCVVSGQESRKKLEHAEEVLIRVDLEGPVLVKPHYHEVVA